MQSACHSAAGTGLGLLCVVLLTVLSPSQAVPDFTCYNVRPYFSNDIPNGHFIGGYKSGSNTDADVDFERVLDTGSGNRLPERFYKKNDGSTVTRGRFPDSIGASRFGAYNCVFNPPYPPYVNITTIILNPNGDVSPFSPTLTTSAGEDVTLNVSQSNGLPTELRWRHNGDDVTKWNGKLSITINNVQVNHSGIYECYRDGFHSQQKHALMKLLVRECSPNKWGPSCENDCRFCQNGGQCDDKTGECICAPGFSGDQCATLHNNNCFGQDCGLRCSSSSAVCTGNLFCPPDPFGCTCAASFTGSNCEEECMEGYYGAGCKLKCHCQGNACNASNGICPTSVTCASGFNGENCQECAEGSFGVDCVQQCHCADLSDCDRGNGRCREGVMCQPDYRGENCQNSCPYGMIGLQPKCSSCYVPVSVSYQATFERDTVKNITWKAPQNKCPVIDYAVQYQLVNRDLCLEVEGEIKTMHNTSFRESTVPYTDSSLYAYSMYKIRVVARNEAGMGDIDDGDYINYTTPEKEPSRSPDNFQMNSATKRSFVFTWDEILCGHRNGRITEFSISYRVIEKPYDTNFIPNYLYRRANITAPDRQCNIGGLEPSTKYEFLLVGINSAGKGVAAKLEVFTLVETDIDPPARPSDDDVSELTSSTVTLALKLPSSSTYITGVQIGVRQAQSIVRRETSRFRQQRSNASPDYVASEVPKQNLPNTFTVGDGNSQGSFQNQPLNSDTEYDIYIGSVSRTSDKDVAVVWGEPLRVKVPPAQSPSAAAVVVPLLLVIIVCIVAAVVIKIRLTRKRNLDSQESTRPIAGNAAQRSSDDRFNGMDEIPYCEVANQPPSTVQTTVSVIVPETVPATRPSQPCSPSKPKQRPANRKNKFATPHPVPLSEFKDYVCKKKGETYKDGNGFLWDYENLPEDADRHPFEVAKHDENKKKNRYANIIPYDFSRVVLDKLPNQPYSDYVNANYMDGFNEAKRYIASQGPNKASVSDMWRMVWQEKTAKIVMLTNLQEGIKGKCEKYWPDKTGCYGDYVVSLIKEELHSDYIIRDFTLCMKLENQVPRTVRQYHYVAWPDMGLPQDPIKVVNFVKIVKEYNPQNAGPMIVHCSAGIGRTGVFLVLDAMLDQAKAENKVDIWNFACGMRDRRMKMIQTPAQYEFIFDVFVETFLCGDTAINPGAILSHLAALNKVTKPGVNTGLQQQFESLNMLTYRPRPDKYKGGRHPNNVNKNRFPDKLPVDIFRPHLMKSGDDGSTDYINACFINSFSAKGKYIATQMPLPHTISDMWKMIYDYKSTCVVMLNTIDANDPTCRQYWPDEDSVQFDSFTVIKQSTDKMGKDIIVRYLTLVNSNDQDSRLICHLQLLNWPTGRVPASPRSLLKLVTAVQEWQREHGDDRVTIQCIDGEGASGTFCALMNIIQQLDIEKEINVFQAVKKLRSARHGLVQSMDQYKLLYDALQMHLDIDVVYENL